VAAAAAAAAAGMPLTGGNPNGYADRQTSTLDSRYQGKEGLSRPLSNFQADHGNKAHH